MNRSGIRERKADRLAAGIAGFLTLSLLFAGGAAANHAFQDVDDGAFYADAVDFLKERQITLGCSATEFCPDQAVTRGQMAAFLERSSRRGLHRPGFTETTIASPGSSFDLTIGSDGLALISHYDPANEDLEVAHCIDLACTSATVSDIDTAGNVGFYNSITVGSDGLGLISYHDETNEDLKVAHCSDVACSTATASAIDTVGEFVGLETSIAIGTDGLGLISYRNEDLKVAHCSDVSCTSATITTLDTAGLTGVASSLTIGADGLGLITHFENGAVDLRVTHCSNIACTAATTNPLVTGLPGGDSSLAVGADGLGLVNYRESPTQVKMAHCSNSDCSVATFNSVGDGTLGEVAIGADGTPVFVYSTSGVLKLARCTDVVCTAAPSAVVLSVPVSSVQIALGIDGFPLIGFLRASFLKIVHCPSVFCIPNHRPR